MKIHKSHKMLSWGKFRNLQLGISGINHFQKKYCPDSNRRKCTTTLEKECKLKRIAHKMSNWDKFYNFRLRSSCTNHFQEKYWLDSNHRKCKMTGFEKERRLKCILHNMYHWIYYPKNRWMIYKQISLLLWVNSISNLSSLTKKQKTQ